MSELARMMILLGAVLIVLGLVMLGIQKLPFAGRLPGDIVIKRESFTFYFPLATSIIVSILISLILYLINKFR
jgi:dipeptide/tripeptide permease